tara:strand:+ start:228 stop:419 length:192 start_codon:yes stop_codon:yes gene_type:complete
MIYPIKSSNYEVSKSDLKNKISGTQIRRVKYFEHIDKPMLDQVVRDMKSQMNFKDYHLIVLEV